MKTSLQNCRLIFLKITTYPLERRKKLCQQIATFLLKIQMVRTQVFIVIRMVISNTMEKF